MCRVMRVVRSYLAATAVWCVEVVTVDEVEDV